MNLASEKRGVLEIWGFLRRGPVLGTNPGFRHFVSLGTGLEIWFD
jgi:hypothetical protein